MKLDTEKFVALALVFGPPDFKRYRTMDNSGYIILPNLEFMKHVDRIFTTEEIAYQGYFGIMQQYESWYTLQRT